MTQESATAGGPTEEPRDLLDELAGMLAESDAPVAPPGQNLFPVERVNHAGLHAELQAKLRDYRARSVRDPYANPIQLLALEIRRMLREEALPLSALEQLVQRLTAGAFVERAKRLATYLGATDPDRNAQAVAALIRGIAGNRGGSPLPFDAFRRRIEAEVFGIVFTAHPTFGLSEELLRALAALATDRHADGRPLSRQDRRALLRLAVERVHKPAPGLDLLHEHALSLTALGHAQDALNRLYYIVLRVAEELYPHRWRELVPRLVTLASWVGYDLDGRSDIRWTDTFTTRLRVQVLQLERYRNQVGGALDLVQDRKAEPRTALETLDRRLELAIAETRHEIAAFEAGDAKGGQIERIRRVAKRMWEYRDQRLREVAPLLALVNQALAAAGDDAELARRLCVLRAEVANHGLGMARTHVRLNAKQLHNAVRKTVGLQAPPEDPAHRRSYLAAVEAALAQVTPQSINFGSILAEKASAKRLTMVVAQMLKYVDASTPVRFLIAECEAGATLLTALYFARLFGIDGKLDISPLFETAQAMDQAGLILEEALSSAHFRDYLRRRGRLCVQVGFSDSGRYIGQTAAGFAIERVRFKVAELMQRHDLRDVQLVFFNTHGESIGRGAHPASFAARLRYLATPASRARFQALGIEAKEEVSFQGGDGFLYFMGGPVALATTARVLEYGLSTPDAGDDPFYAESDYTAEFFTTVSQFNQKLMGDPSFARLMGAYGVNMIYPTGSRSLKRAAAGGDAADISRLRAIPQNAILQQMGMLANSVGGLAEAIQKDPERFARLYTHSPRLRTLMAMAEYAARFSDTDVLRAYIDSFDPTLWLLAMKATGPEAANDMHLVSNRLERLDLHDSLRRVQRTLLKEFVDLCEHLGYCGIDFDDGPRVQVPDRCRETLHLLHALRIALIHEIYLLAVRIPEFAPQLNTSQDRIMARILRLDVQDSVRLLLRIFPKTDATLELDDFGEPATYRSDGTMSYEAEHETIFAPLSRLHELVRRIGSGISHVLGAVG